MSAPRAALPAVLALLAAGCAAPPSPAPRPLPAPWPTAESADGLWRLRIEHLARSLDADGGTATIELQAKVEPALDADTLLGLSAGGDPLRRAVADRGGDIPLDGHPARVDPLHGRLFVHGLRADAAATSLRLLEAEMRFLRVKTWTEFTTRPLDVGDGAEMLCPPARATVRTEPGVCWVAAYYGDDVDEAPGGRDLFGLLPHDALAAGADVRDARGRRLLLQSGMGTGGTTVCRFVPREALDPSGPEGQPLIEYPVTVTVRVPADYSVERALFRFEDLRLPTPRRVP